MEKTRDSIPLVVAGDGPLAGTEWPTGVSWIGSQPREKILALMSEARVLIVPSECYENGPLAALEAFACGLPVIASNLGSMAETVAHELTGLLFNPGEPADLARKVRWAFEHPEAMAAMRVAARREFEEKYTAEKNYKMLINIYEQAMERAWQLSKRDRAHGRCFVNGKRVLVTGAGGFIGHHLTKYLVERGYWVRGVDIKEPEYENTHANEFLMLDLRFWENCLDATRDMDEVYALAANMGGIGFIETNKAVIVRDNTLINHHTIEAARVNGVSRFLYTSSACVYPGYIQQRPDVTALTEEDAYPADAEDGYGWEKLYMERTCRHYREDFGLETRVVQNTPIYGPLGTYDGGREKSPAAICRKVALANNGGSIEVWGDGEQTRSYCYIDDCVEGIYRLMRSDVREPLNLGTEHLVSINGLVDLVAGIAGKRIGKNYDLSKPQGVRGRNSDNTRLREVLGWEPSTSLEAGLDCTYHWIAGQLCLAGVREAVA